VALYILRYDGVERFAEGDATPTKNKIMNLMIPLDEQTDTDRFFAKNVGTVDTVKYTVVDTTSEIFERSPGRFEGLTVVILEKVKEKTDES
jgi:hypothetical protein